jgi:Cd2+/Zn2+-exporting ATPase
MGALGSDAAIETADVVLMTDSPSKVAVAIEVAGKTRKIVWQNILFALGVKAAFIVLGILGVATMWEAVFGDMGVALIAVANSMRILKD